MKIKNNILGFIIGGIVFGSVGITVASQILATQVSYSNEKSKEGITSVAGAITELYGIAEECQTASSGGSGVTYYGKDAVAIYLDPTNLSTTCSSAASSNTGTINGCMRFWVYAEDGEYKYAILDHNTTAKVSSGFYAAQSQVKQDTVNWDPNLQARNIRADEVYKITKSANNGSSWQIKEGDMFYFYNYGWLIDRTYNCTNYGGCATNDTSVQGYWTSDAQNSSKAWYLYYDGRLTFADSWASPIGVRPVIQIAK